MSLAGIKNLAKADSIRTVGRDRLTPGIYTLGIKKLWTKKSDVSKHELVIASFKVLDSQQTDPQFQPAPVGSTRSTVFDMDDEYGYGVRDFASLIAGIEGQAILGEDLVKLATQLVDEKTQPGRGYVVKAEVKAKENKKDAKSPFMDIAYGHIPNANDEGSIKKRRAEFEADGV